MFMKHDAMIKEERKKQNNELSNILMKQMKEIEDLKLSIERKNCESRRKREEVQIFFFKDFAKQTVCQITVNMIMFTGRKQNVDGTVE